MLITNEKKVLTKKCQSHKFFWGDGWHTPTPPPPFQLLANMSEKQVCLYQWDHLINCNENDNWKIDHINKTYIDQNVDIETNIENIAVSVRQYLYVISNTEETFQAQFIKKLSNNEADLKKSVAYKKVRRAFKFRTYIWVYVKSHLVNGPIASM